MAEYIELETLSADGCYDVSKIKTPFAWIIVEETAAKPYYSILWWDTEKRKCYVGYSSYSLEYVFNWLKENFEITEEDADVAPARHGQWGTNSDRPDSLICSVCNCGFDMWKHDPHNYCPNCGEKMDLEDAEKYDMEMSL